MHKNQQRGNGHSLWEREGPVSAQDQMEEVGNGAEASSARNFFGHKEIAELAHQLWVRRGCPSGSAEADWFAASKQLRGEFIS